MIFNRTKIEGVVLIELEEIEDSRGFFARAWCKEEFKENGLNSTLEQCNFAFNRKRGTLRGLHYQAKPFEEAKLIRCIKGAIFDVVVDIRPNSATYKQHQAFNLIDTNRHALYIPEGCAHGYQTLEDNSEVFYQMSRSYAPEYAKGLRWNDPAFSIDWPIKNPIILERDGNYPDFISPTPSQLQYEKY